MRHQILNVNAPVRRANCSGTCPLATKSRGRSGRKKMGRALPYGGNFLGCRKVDFRLPLARKKPEIHFSTPEAGLSGQKSIKRTQKYCVVRRFGCFRVFPPNPNFKMPVRRKYYRYGLLLRGQERGS